ncbi:TetR/AcrR family transcriptional regulator [Bacillus sp. SM2101]|uniref:TetR/AcrR family transcriptional regulator n=1 Tax=Bacillus sp. SM2101 TaxID=2805366 RepID=UPI001BDE0445|nr:TetR/AcrR family transcriptional regulator [Bacillus sp. SM2101]
MKETKNELSKRSQRLIREALIEILKEKSYKSITIKDIVQRAELARKTFYLNYESKEEVISHHIALLYEKQLNPFNDDIDPINYIMDTYLRIWNENIDLIIMLKNQELSGLLRILEKEIEDVGHKMHCKAFMNLSESAHYYAPSYYAGAMLSILDKWVDTGMKEDIETIREVFFELMRFRLPTSSIQ